MQNRRNALEYVYLKPALSLILGWVLIIAGILISDIPKMIESQGWPTTRGTILYHRYSGVKFKEYDGDYYTNTVVYIRYEYIVDGIAHTSLSINSIDTPFYPTKYASQYPVGKDVIVYYNPVNPSDAVLVPGFVDVFKAFGGFSNIFIWAGVIINIIGISWIQKNRYNQYVKELIEKYTNE